MWWIQDIPTDLEKWKDRSFNRPQLRTACTTIDVATDDVQMKKSCAGTDGGAWGQHGTTKISKWIGWHYVKYVKIWSVNCRSVFINIGGPNGCFFLTLLHRRRVGRSWPLRVHLQGPVMRQRALLGAWFQQIRTFCQQELRYWTKHR